MVVDGRVRRRQVGRRGGILQLQAGSIPGRHHTGEAAAPWTPRELLLKSVLLPRMALQLSSPWSSMLVNLLNMPSSGLVWRGPVPKIQVTPSASPSGWQDPQLLQASRDCLRGIPRDDGADVRA